MPFLWLASQLAWAGLHEDFAETWRFLLLARLTLPQSLKTFMEKCQQLKGWEWDFKVVLYNLLHWLPASLHLPAACPWNTWERIHRSLHVLCQGWLTMFLRHPELVEYYQQLAEMFIGDTPEREFL